MHKNRKRDALNMNLWIKTQNEGLHQIIGINAPYVQKDCTSLVGYSNYKHIELGVYQTKQRALEVLDEIQSFLENNYISIDEMPSHSNSPYPGYYPAHISTMYRKKVFKMPKE